MSSMGEPEIRRTGFPRRRPGNGILDFAIMTGGATHRSGPHGVPRLYRADVARLAGGEEFSMFEVIKGCVAAAGNETTRGCCEEQQCGHDGLHGSGIHRPVGSWGVRTAGGNENRSASEPNSTTRPAAILV
jgi:hypothetical protein